jgi:hypothetical protein
MWSFLEILRGGLGRNDVFIDKKMTLFVGKFFALSGNTNLSQNRIHQKA